VRWLIVSALALAAAAQPSRQIALDVTVVGRTAAALTNLSAADFEVEIDGRVEAVRAAEVRPVTAATEMAGAVGPVFDAAPMPPAAVYRLSIEATAGSKADAAINVRLKRADLNVVSARRAAAVTSPPEARTPPRPTGSVEDRLRDAVASGRVAPTFPVAVGRSIRRGPAASQLLLNVTIDIPAGTPGPISVLLGIVDPKGAIGSAKRTIDADREGGAYHLDLTLPLSPATYKLRVAAADANGTVASVELPVTAQLAPAGSMTVSDLLRSTGDASDRRRPVTNDVIPAEATTLFLGLELYPAAEAPPPPDLLVNMSLTLEGANTPTTERVVTPELRDGALVAQAEFGLQRLGPGRYLARAIVLSGARPLGTVDAIVKR
jgi:hypothetical protein